MQDLLNYIKPICQKLLEQKNLPLIHKKILSIKFFNSKLESSPNNGIYSDININDIVEVENKYLVDNIDEIKKRIVLLDFMFKENIVQHDFYYDMENELRNIGQDVRIRSVYDKDGEFICGELKWEGEKGNINDRAVIEVRLKERILFDKIKTWFEKKLGMQKFVNFEKTRWHYIRLVGKHKFEIELDQFTAQNPPKIKNKTYIQVSLEVPEQERTEAVELVKDMARQLGLKREDNRDYYEITVNI